MQEISLEADICSHHFMSTKLPIDPNTNIDHSHFVDANITYGTNICSAQIIDSGMLQSTQHKDVIGDNVAIFHFDYQHPLASTMFSLHTLQVIRVPHVAKGQSYTKHEPLINSI